MIARCIAFAVIFAASINTIARADDLPAIDHWRFSWNIIRGENFHLDIEKDPDNTTIQISSGLISTAIVLTPKEAEQIGKVLLATDDEYKKLKALSSDNNDNIDAGNYTVTFVFSQKDGFFAVIRSKERFTLSQVQMSRDQAKDAAKYMIKATSLASVVDKKINP